MNEFPPKYLEVVRECSGSTCSMLNATEYLERVFATGVTESDLPVTTPSSIAYDAHAGDDRLLVHIEAVYTLMNDVHPSPPTPMPPAW